MSENKADALLDATKRDIGLEKPDLVQEREHDLESYGQTDASREMGSWSRTRLFEAAVAHEGITRYLRDLASYQGSTPERDVKVNAFLAATHISTALNPVVWDAIVALRKSGKLRLDEKQLHALECVLKPSREYRLAGTAEGVDFDPLVLEDLRSEVQRAVFDQLDSKGAAQRGKGRNQRSEADTGAALLGVKMPADLEKIAETKRIDIKNAVELSKRYGSLKVAVQDGYMIWKFSNKPTLYLNEDSIYYSKKSSGGTIAEARLQVEVISKLLSGRARMCSICQRRQGSEVAYLENGEVSLVCSQCERDPRVVRLIPSLPPSES